MKKAASILLALVMALPLAVCGAPAAGAKNIKVGLLYGDRALVQVIIGANGYKICEDTGGGITQLAQSGQNGDIIANLEGGAISLLYKNADKAFFTYTGSGLLTLYPASGYIYFNGLAYRGGIQLIPKNGKLNVVNLVDFEQYLYGVVTKEMYASWPLEALKAQAVCSRTYLLASGLSRHKEDGFDLCDTVHCQAYGGVAKESPNGIAAVEQTRGQVVTYQGKIAHVFYYASDGGATEDVKNVWGGDNYPYLVSVQDKYENPDEAKSAWRVEFTGEELGKKLAASGHDIGVVTSVEILQRTPSGRVLRLALTGEKGTCTLEKEKTRTVFGLRSQLYDIQASGGQSLAPAWDLGRSGPLSLASVGGIFSPEGGLYLMSMLGVRPAAARGATFIFNGRGYGHGVGMSQWGAKGMADAGFKYDAIVKYYFPGVELGNYQ